MFAELNYHPPTRSSLIMRDVRKEVRVQRNSATPLMRANFPAISPITFSCRRISTFNRSHVSRNEDGRG